MFAHKELWFVTLIALGILTTVVIGVIKTTDVGSIVPPITQGCTIDEECGGGQFCNKGACQQFAPDTSCQTDGDCQLINKDFAYSCCYAGSCQGIDYSQDKWIAVNSNSFLLQQEQVCPTKDQCGPAPACPSYMVNDKFAARCVSGVCQKLPTTEQEEAMQSEQICCMLAPGNCELASQEQACLSGRMVPCGSMICNPQFN